jgi:hypothetical protein
VAVERGQLADPVGLVGLRLGVGLGPEVVGLPVGLVFRLGGGLVGVVVAGGLATVGRTVARLADGAGLELTIALGDGLSRT